MTAAVAANAESERLSSVRRQLNMNFREVMVPTRRRMSAKEGYSELRMKQSVSALGLRFLIVHDISCLCTIRFHWTVVVELGSVCGEGFQSVLRLSHRNSSSQRTQFGGTFGHWQQRVNVSASMEAHYRCRPKAWILSTGS